MATTGKTMFRAFLTRLASGGFGADSCALLFLLFFDITPLLQRQIERFPPGEESSANPTIGRLAGRIAAGQAGVNDASCVFLRLTEISAKDWIATQKNKDRGPR
jgi:hypothetical protein